MNFIEMIKGVGSLKEALESGRMVKDPVGWKNVSITTNRIAAIIAFVLVVLRVMDINLPVTDENIVIISGGLATILLGIQNILTVATTNKLGKEKKETTE